MAPTCYVFAQSRAEFCESFGIEILPHCLMNELECWLLAFAQFHKTLRGPQDESLHVLDLTRLVGGCPYVLMIPGRRSTALRILVAASKIRSTELLL